MLERNAIEGAPLSGVRSADSLGGHAAAATATTEAERRRVLGVYKQMLACHFYAALIVIGLLAVAIFPYFLLYALGRLDAEVSSVFLVVVMAGSLGALFSSIIRLYNFEDLPKALVADGLKGLPTGHLIIYSLVPIIIGAIAAAVLYVAFAGDLITSGGPFPKFDCQPKGESCSTFITFVSYWSPKSAADFAKVIVWGFVAGFAERFVPDTLRTLSKSSAPKTS